MPLKRISWLPCIKSSNGVFTDRSALTPGPLADPDLPSIPVFPPRLAELNAQSILNMQCFSIVVYFHGRGSLSIVHEGKRPPSILVESVPSR